MRTLRVALGSGADRIRGGDKNDKLWGGAGWDRLDGGKGTDTCYPGAGGGKKVRCELPKPRVLAIAYSNLDHQPGFIHPPARPLAPVLIESYTTELRCP